MTLNDIIYVLMTSLLPVIEIRGALPLALALDMPAAFAFTLCVIGNMLPIPFLILLTRKILNWMKTLKFFGPIAKKIEAKGLKNSKGAKKLSFWGLLILVAIPLPGTGAWTGALVASLLNMRLKDSLPAIFIGVCTAGIIVLLVSLGIIHLL